jgi:hypothetical protein
MTLMHDVRRHCDGSIDIDFYRARGQALRRAHLAQAGRASRRHLAQLIAQLADCIRPDRPGQAVMQTAVARRGQKRT